MRITATCDMTPISKQLRELVRLSKGREASDIIKEEGGFLAFEAMRSTPPKTYAQGRNAVSSQVNAMFYYISDRSFKRALNQPSDGPGRDYWARRGKRSIHFHFDRIDETGEGMRQFHYSQLDRHGRFKRKPLRSFEGDEGTAAYAVSLKSYKTFLKEKLDHVGWAKSRWIPCIKAMLGTIEKLRIGNWIKKKKAESDKHASWDFSHLNAIFGEKYLTFANSYPGCQLDDGQFAWAVRKRARALATKIKLLIEKQKRPPAEAPTYAAG